MELAVKMIHSHGRRTSPEKYEIVALENSFHGRSMGALSLTGQPKYRVPFEPVIPGITPDDLDLFELHDAFSIMSALSLEACGFAERGQGVRLGLDGSIELNGCIPVCTRGGLKARGHPVGATGMYQVVEVAQKFNGLADETRVKIVKLISKGEFTVDELVEFLGEPQSTTSHHLRVLKEANLIKGEKRGRNIYYSLVKPEDALAEAG
jgi:DNA-binding transcriptional ArsR family regulator